MERLDKFYFPRNSTVPLEHKFGCCRKRSKFVHTLNKFLRVVSIMQTIEQRSIFERCNKCEEELEKIHSRTQSFGVIVEDKIEFEDSDQKDNDVIIQEKLYSPQQIAKAMLFFAGFCPFEYEFIN